MTCTKSSIRLLKSTWPVLVSNGPDVSVTDGLADAADALMIQIAAGVFAKQPMQWSVLVNRVKGMKPVIVPAQQFLIDALLQCLEELSTYRLGSDVAPWELNGVFLNKASIETYQSLPLHNAMRLVLTLHIKVFYDAPIKSQLETVVQLESASTGIEGIVFEPQWLFLSAMVSIRAGKDEAEVQVYRHRLKAFSKVKDWKYRLDILDVLMALRESWVDGLALAEKTIELLNKEFQHPLSGKLLAEARLTPRSLGVPD